MEATQKKKTCLSTVNDPQYKEVGGKKPTEPEMFAQDGHYEGQWVVKREESKENYERRKRSANGERR